MPFSKDAIESAIDYEAQDSIVVDQINSITYLYGAAVVKYEKITLKAAYIEIDNKKNTLTAKGIRDSTNQLIGKPIFSDDGQSFEAEEMRYNFETKKGKILKVITEESGGYVHGEQVKKNELNQYFIQNGKYTTCNAETPHFHLQASKLKILPNDKVVSGPAYFAINDIPTPLVLPFGIFPNRKTKTSGILLPTYGKNRYGHFFSDGGYYWAINDFVDVSVTGAFYSKGSWVGKVRSNYAKRYKYNGNLFFQMQNMLNGEPEIDQTRNRLYQIQWRHTQNQKASPNNRAQFSSNVNYTSTKLYAINALGNYNNNQYNASQRSNINYSAIIPNSPFSYSIFTDMNQNLNSGDVVLNLPTMSFNMNSIYLRNKKKVVGTPKWYQNFRTRYSASIKNQANVHDTLLFTNQMFDAFQNGISHSIPITNSFKTKRFVISPSFNFSSYWSTQYVNKSSYEDEFIESNGFTMGNFFSASTSFRTNLYGDYTPVIKSPILKIRHQLTPTFSINYIPDYTAEKWRKFSGYREVVDTLGNVHYFTPLNNNVAGKPGIGKRGSFDLGLSNTIQMKVKTPKDTVNATKKVSLLDKLSFNTGYNFFADSLNWDDVTFNGNAKINSFINFNFGGAFTGYYHNDNGFEINESYFQNTGKLARLKRSNIAVNMRFTSKRQGKQDLARRHFNEDEYNYYVQNQDYYIDFSIPWTINLYYSLSVNNRYEDGQFNPDMSQTMNVNGDFNLTQNWKVGYHTGYDFVNKGISSITNFSISRNLHCWEMTLTWKPVGTGANYTFQINPKSSLLQDLKLNRRKLNGDYGQL